MIDAPHHLAGGQRVGEVELRHALRPRGGRQQQRGEQRQAQRHQTNRMMNAITSAYSATASVSANPRMARPNTRSRAAGLRATLLTRAAKM